MLSSMSPVPRPWAPVRTTSGPSCLELRRASWLTTVHRGLALESIYGFRETPLCVVVGRWWMVSYYEASCKSEERFVMSPRRRLNICFTWRAHGRPSALSAVTGSRNTYYLSAGPDADKVSLWGPSMTAWSIRISAACQTASSMHDISVPGTYPVNLYGPLCRRRTVTAGIKISVTVHPALHLRRKGC